MDIPDIQAVDKVFYMDSFPLRYTVSNMLACLFFRLVSALVNDFLNKNDYAENQGRQNHPHSYMFEGRH